MESPDTQTQAEEQVSLPPTRHVAEAYSTNDRRNKMKNYLLWFLVFAFAVVFHGGGGDGRGKKHRRAKALRKKAESLPEVAVQHIQQVNRKIELDENYAQLNEVHARFDKDSADGADVRDEDALDREVEAVFEGVESVEEDEISGKNSMLTSAVQTMEESVKFYLGKVFGNGEDAEYDDDDSALTSADTKLSEEQLDAIAEKISQRLDAVVKKEFRAKADGVREEKMNQIHTVVTEDRKANMKAQDIQRDVHEAETVVLEDLRDEIDDAAKRVKDDIPNKLVQIRNEVVEEVTGENLDDVIKRKEFRKEQAQELVKTFNEMKKLKGTEAGAKNEQIENMREFLGVQAKARQKMRAKYGPVKYKKMQPKEKIAARETMEKFLETQAIDRSSMSEQLMQKASAKGDEMNKFRDMQTAAREAVMAKYGPEAREKMDPKEKVVANQAMIEFLKKQATARGKMRAQLSLKGRENSSTQARKEVKESTKQSNKTGVATGVGRKVKQAATNSGLSGDGGGKGSRDEDADGKPDAASDVTRATQGERSKPMDDPEQTVNGSNRSGNMYGEDGDDGSHDAATGEDVAAVDAAPDNLPVPGKGAGKPDRAKLPRTTRTYHGRRGVEDDAAAKGKDTASKAGDGTAKEEDKAKELGPSVGKSNLSGENDDNEVDDDGEGDGDDEEGDDDGGEEDDDGEGDDDEDESKN